MENSAPAKIQNSREEIPGDLKGDGLFGPEDEENGGLQNADGHMPEVIPSKRLRPIGPQEPFQPGSTTQSEFRKFLNWNEHGVARYFAAGEEGKLSARNYNRIEVQFFNRPNVMSINQAADNLRLVAIGPGYCALALGRSDGDTMQRQAKLQVLQATDWDRPILEKLFPPEEEVEAMAISKEFLALATSRRFLHVMTTLGLSLGLVSLPGPVVVMASFNDLFLVIFHSGPLCGDDQCLDYWLLNARTQTRISGGRLPVSPGSRVVWAGFNTDALPLVLDSNGKLRGLLRGEGAFADHEGLGGSWVPLLDLSSVAPEGKSLWPVRAELEELMCIEADAASEPEVRTTHQLQAVKFSMPLGLGFECPEEAMLRTRVLSDHLTHVVGEGSLQPERLRSSSTEKRQRSMVAAKAALRLFGSFAENGEVEKALDVAACFSSYGDQQHFLFNLAKDFARKSDCFELADRIRIMAPPEPKRVAEEKDCQDAPPTKLLRSCA